VAWEVQSWTVEELRCGVSGERRFIPNTFKLIFARQIWGLLEKLVISQSSFDSISSRTWDEIDFLKAVQLAKKPTEMTCFDNFLQHWLRQLFIVMLSWK